MSGNHVGDSGIAAGSLVVGHEDDELAVGKQLDGSEANGGADQLQRLLQAKRGSLQLVAHPVGRRVDEKIVFGESRLRSNRKHRPFMAGGDADLMWVLIDLLRI